METKFTKGEWMQKTTVSSSINGVEKIGVFPIDDCGFFSHAICHIDCNNEYGRPEAEANAKLIAACPKMYEYIYKKAQLGDKDAKLILATIE